jgi:predicted TIM-barrel fold metal-dependent hydrolase
MFNHRCDAESVTPILSVMITLFGAERCMFGSNFPVDKLWVSYNDMIAAYDSAMATLTSPERHALMHNTAWRVYGFKKLETKIG